MTAAERYVDTLRRQLRRAIFIGDYLGAMWLRQRYYRAIRGR
jgi:hypothetical protein